MATRTQKAMQENAVETAENISQTQQSENNVPENSVPEQSPAESSEANASQTQQPDNPVAEQSPEQSPKTTASQTQQTENNTPENSAEENKAAEQSPAETESSEKNDSTQQTGDNASEPLPEIREVKGYCPKDKMISIKDYSGRDSLYLEVKYRKEWFLRWCKEQGHVGVLDDSDIRYNPECRLVEGRATVTVDGKIIGKSAACKPYDPTLGNLSPTVFQDVGTIALGRALANAGFGTVNGFLDDGDTRTLADAPVAIPAQITSTAPVSDNPMIQMANAATTQQTPSQKQRQSQNAAQPQSDKSRKKQDPDIASVSSVEEAKKAVMPIGANKGKTLSEIYEIKKEAIVYFANRGTQKFEKPGYENLTKACAMILDAEKSA